MDIVPDNKYGPIIIGIIKTIKSFTVLTRTVFEKMIDADLELQLIHSISIYGFVVSDLRGEVFLFTTIHQRFQDKTMVSEFFELIMDSYDFRWDHRAFLNSYEKWNAYD